MSDTNGRRVFLKSAGAIGITGLTAGSAAVGTVAADETVTATGVVFHGDESNSTIPDFDIIFSGPERYDADLSESEKDYYNFKAVPGEYSVLVRAEGYQYVTETVTVEPDGFQQFDFALEPQNAGTLTGRVVDMNGDPIENEYLSINRVEDSSSLTTSLDSNGEFEIDLQEGEWELEADITGYENKTRTVSVTEGETTEETLEVSSNNKAEVSIILDFEGDPSTTWVLFDDSSVDTITFEPGEIEKTREVEAGTYDLEIWPNNHSTVIDNDVELEAGSENILLYELEEL